MLSYFYPTYLLGFQLLIMLDIFSHWFQMYRFVHWLVFFLSKYCFYTNMCSSLMHGETSHKFIDLSANPIMKFYYERVSQWIKITLKSAWLFHSICSQCCLSCAQGMNYFSVHCTCCISTMDQVAVIY